MSTKASRPLPSRIIDVGPADGSQAPRIYISKKSEVGSWLILSHCWGQGRRYVTNTSNLASGVRSLPYDELPSVFKDAITAWASDIGGLIRFAYFKAQMQRPGPIGGLNQAA